MTIARTTAVATAVQVKVAVPESVHVQYECHAIDTDKPIETVMATQLARFAHVPPTDRVLLLTGAEREVLEQLFSTPLPDATALIKAVRQAVELNLAGAKMVFAPYQMLELKQRAEKNGTSIKVEVERAVKQISGLVFNAG